MNMIKKVFRLIVVILCIVIVVKAFNHSNKTNKDTDSIKIGAPLVLSGDSAKYGQTAKNGIDIALAEYNAKTEVVEGKFPKIEVIYEDTHADPKTTLSAYQKLVGIDNVISILGPLFQTEMSAIIAPIKKDGTPTIGIAPIPFDQRNNISNPLVV